MMGFFLQNAIAMAVGAVAGALFQLVYSDTNQFTLLTIIACGFIGVHLPNIQQPTLLSYRLLRWSSWMGSLLIPAAIFFYRPTDFILAWIMTIIFTHGFWAIIDRISLQRDFTRSVSGIILFPLMVTGCVWLALGETATVPAFLACSFGYILFLFIEHHMQQFKQPSNTDQQHNTL